MPKKITIGAATQLGIGPLVTVQVLLSENGTTTADRYYVFSANEFSATYDNELPNICVLHFGGQHSLTISNADYQEFEWTVVSKATAIALATAVIDDIAQYTT